MNIQEHPNTRISLGFAAHKPIEIIFLRVEFFRDFSQIPYPPQIIDFFWRNYFLMFSCSCTSNLCLHLKIYAPVVFIYYISTFSPNEGQQKELGIGGRGDPRCRSSSFLGRMGRKCH